MIENKIKDEYSLKWPLDKEKSLSKDWDCEKISYLELKVKKKKGFTRSRIFSLSTPSPRYKFFCWMDGSFYLNVESLLSVEIRADFSY